MEARLVFSDYIVRLCLLSLSFMRRLIFLFPLDGNVVDVGMVLRWRGWRSMETAWVMKINEFRSWVILWEGAVLLFSCGGEFVTNGEGEVRYNGGGVRLRSIKDGLTLDELRLMISEWIGGDGRNYDIKYTVAFDEKTLIDLHDNAEMYNLFQYNGNSGHVYVTEKRQLSEENARECDNDEISGPPNVDKSIGAEDTDGSEMVHAEWRGLLTGVGQRFPSADVFRVSVYKFALANKFVAKYMRNSKEFMSIRCKVEGCPWKLCANHVGKSCDVLRVTTFINRHVHSAQDSLDVMHSGRASLNSSIIIDEMRDHADKRTSKIRKRLKREYGIDLTYKQAYRAREKSLEDIYGRPEQSYMLIPWVCERIKETDEKSVAEWTAIGNRFERVFIAYGACIEGFLGGARHIMYVDGTHLSGPYKGTMLSASAYDADNELLPFAIAIVKGETLDDWTFFLYDKKNPGFCGSNDCIRSTQCYHRRSGINLWGSKTCLLL
ncbi:uncharacterized protein LOC114741961 [Neltuma alba]|uniref:uncharacterized protein LOC114741961 n=1 Tax=Neltuma alba TaxID=207710 RepID=UPI0010A3DA3A|nr:uncharacterized protein LOC114741961 [Prosopis alba]